MQTAKSPIPASLARARRRFETWRSNRGKERRIPEALWLLATKLGSELGVSLTAKVLRLSYTTLKERIVATDSHAEATVQPEPVPAPQATQTQQQAALQAPQPISPSIPTPQSEKAARHPAPGIATPLQPTSASSSFAAALEFTATRGSESSTPAALPPFTGKQCNSRTKSSPPSLSPMPPDPSFPMTNFLELPQGHGWPGANLQWMPWKYKATLAKFYSDS